jgi:chromosome segregation ATPase
VKRAAAAALASGHTDEASKLNAFLQRKFTGTYSSQAGEVIGIIKNMRDTFKTELSTAEAKEEQAEATYQKVKAALEEEKKLLGERETEIQGTLGENDGDLQTKKKEKKLAEEALADAEAFLEELLDLCAKKKAEYEKRVELRNQEEAAISEAIAILNSDAAFESFGKVGATSGKTVAPQSTFTKTSANVVSFNFLQIANVRNNLRNSQAQGIKALSVLRKSASEFKSLSMARIAALLEANNPFTTVLEAIEEMLGIIKEEGETDLEKKDWCVKEQTKKEADLGVAEANILSLKSEIMTLDKAINDPVVGLKKKISDMEDGLRENTESMTQQTADRKSDNLAYQQNIADLVEAEDLLQKAIVVLKAYYAEAMQTEGTGFIQIQKQGPTPPKTWDTYEGQSNEASGGRTTAIGMLEFILANTKKEEKVAHEFENTNQQDYETSMQEHKDAEAKMQAELADLQGELAEKEKELLDKQKDLEKEEALAASIKKYLATIEPGCTFIKTNIAERDRARKQESEALTEARELLKETPAYKEAVELGTNETLGECADICHDNEDHVACKACAAKVSVPGYCAGHPETDGC